MCCNKHLTLVEREMILKFRAIVCSITCSVRFFSKANPVLPAWIVDSCISERSWQNPIPFLNIDTQGDTVSIFERLDLN